MDTVELKTVTPADVHNFRVGQPVRLVWDERAPGCLRRATRLERARIWLRDRWLSATRWWRPRTVCAAVDVEAGAVTMTTERWSWRRWRWERA